MILISLKISAANAIKITAQNYFQFFSKLIINIGCDKNTLGYDDGNHIQSCEI